MLKANQNNTCFEMYCLISCSEILEPFDSTTNATGTSPATSSFMLKSEIIKIDYGEKQVNCGGM